MPEPKTCKARQYSDQMACDRCGLVWDMNDPEPPMCLTAKEVGDEALARLRVKLGGHMNNATQFAKVRIPESTGCGLAGSAITLQFGGFQIAIVGATAEGAAAAFGKLTDGLKADMLACQKVVMVSGKNLGIGDA